MNNREARRALAVHFTLTASKPQAGKPSITGLYRILIYNPFRAAKIPDQLSLLQRRLIRLLKTQPCKRILASSISRFDVDPCLRIFFRIIFSAVESSTEMRKTKRKALVWQLFVGNGSREYYLVPGIGICYSDIETPRVSLCLSAFNFEGPFGLSV